MDELKTTIQYLEDTLIQKTKQIDALELQLESYKRQINNMSCCCSGCQRHNEILAQEENGLDLE